MSLRAMDAAEYALHLAQRQRPVEWMVWQVPDGRTAELAEELIASFRDIEGAEIEHLSAVDAREFIARVRGAGTPVRVFSGLSCLSDQDWRHIDQQRSQLMRDNAVVLVLDRATTAQLFRLAPNLASFISAAAWSWDDGVTALHEDDRERRLADLRAWSGMSDADVLQRARRGELPDDPEYAEWLVLLDHGRLIASGSTSDDDP